MYMQLTYDRVVIFNVGTYLGRYWKAANVESKGQMKTFKLEVPRERERERKKEMNVMRLPRVNMYDESAHLREREVDPRMSHSQVCS